MIKEFDTWYDNLSGEDQKSIIKAYYDKIKDEIDKVEFESNHKSYAELMEDTLRLHDLCDNLNSGLSEGVFKQIEENKQCLEGLANVLKRSCKVCKGEGSTMFRGMVGPCGTCGVTPLEKELEYKKGPTSFGLGATFNPKDFL